MTSKVYVVQNPPVKTVAGRTTQINLAPAAKYGEFVLLLAPGDVVLDTDSTVKELYKKLENYSNKDWLLLIGDPVAIGLAAAVASDINGGRVNMLRWSKQDRLYVPVRATVLYPTN